MTASRKTTPSSAFRRAMYVPPDRRPADGEETFDDIPIRGTAAVPREDLSDPDDAGPPPRR